MSEGEHNRDTQIPPTPVQIPLDNVLYITDDQRVKDTAHVTLEGRLPYGSVRAIKAYKSEHQNDVYQGEEASLICLNMGHAQTLLDTTIIDEQNIFKIVDIKTGESNVFTVIPVGQLLEMAVWMINHHIAIPELIRNQSTVKTWFGLIANEIIGELGQGSLANQKQFIMRRLRPIIVDRQLLDRRKTLNSVVKNTLSPFYPQQARNRRLIPAARDFLSQLKKLKQELGDIVNYEADIDLITGLEDKITLMERDLEENPHPLPPDFQLPER